MRSSLSVLALFLLASISVPAQQGVVPAPDAIFYNGKIVTVDSASSIQQAFAIKGEEFFAAGTNAKIEALAGRNTRKVDLRGSTVIPGLADDHDHLYATAKTMRRGVDMTAVTSMAEMLTRLRTAVAKAKPGETVFTTTGWMVQPAPTKKDLDQISPEIPIVVIRFRRGAAILNTAALKAAGITRETQFFEGAPIRKDPSGEPTGDAPGFPQALSLLDKLIPPPNQEEEEELILKGLQERNALGLTSIRELGLFPDAMRAYYRVWRQGKLTGRVSVALDQPDVSKAASNLAEWGVGPGFGDHWLRLDSVGEEPWAPNDPPAQFTEFAIAANRMGWRLTPHVAGDPTSGIQPEDAMKATLEAYEAVDRDSSIKDKRWIVEHIPFATPEQMDRLARLGVVVSTQYAGYIGGYEAAVKTVGKERAERETPIRTMLDHHLVVCAGSDYAGDPDHPHNPYEIFYFYVTRKTRDGRVIGPEEKISREEALRLFTINAAYATFEEKVKGSIEPGKLADFVVLSQDLMTVADDKILSTRALATYVGGRKVFSTENTNF